MFRGHRVTFPNGTTSEPFTIGEALRDIANVLAVPFERKRKGMLARPAWANMTFTKRNTSDSRLVIEVRKTGHDVVCLLETQHGCHDAWQLLEGKYEPEWKAAFETD